MPARLLEDPVADGDDQASLLGQWDEVVREDQAPRRMLPAGESLDPGDAPVPEPDDRLVMDHELLPFDGATQFLLELEAVNRSGAHLRIEQLRATPAPPPGLVPGDAGVAEELVGGAGTGRGGGDPDTDLRPDGATIDLDRSLKSGEETVGEGNGVLWIRQVLGQDGELVPPDPGQDRAVGGPEDLLDPVRDGLQELVARTVAQAVDSPAFAELDDEHRARLVAAPAERECLTHPIKEERPVGQAGQGVVEDDLAELILECPALRDIPDGQHEPADIGVAQEVDDGGL